MFQSFSMGRLEELIVEALDLGIYKDKNYKIDGDITYVSFRFDNLSVSGAFRDNKCVVLKIWLYEGNVKIPVIGGIDSDPRSRNWITNEKNLKSKTLDIITKIKFSINESKQQHSFKAQRAV